MVAVPERNYAEKEGLKEQIVHCGEAPADFKIYHPGNYCFRLKAGEKSDHWIRPLRGIRTILRWASNNGSYEVESREESIGEVSKKNEVPEQKDSDFRIRATDDTLVLLRIIEE